MASPSIHQPIGARATHPGRILRRELEAREMTQAELAARMRRPPQVISDIVREKKAVTAETADGLEMALGMPAHIWLNLQSNYELTQRRLKHRRELEERAAEYEEILEAIGVREVIKREWIAKRDSQAEQIRELLSFFGAQSFEAVEHTAVATAFRVTPGSRVEPWRLATWMRRGELLASQRPPIPRFDREGLIGLLPSIRRLTRSDSPWRPLRDECALVGLHVLVVPHLPKSGANGVTFWLNSEAPVIQLSLLRKSADKFWFTFFHEVAHVLDGHRKDAHIDLSDMPRADQVEEAANRFAEDTLIPPSELRDFLSNGQFGRQSIVAFARSIEVHPGIVVGRLQSEAQIPRSWHNDLCVSLEGSMFVD